MFGIRAVYCGAMSVYLHTASKDDVHLQPPPGELLNPASGVEYSAKVLEKRCRDSIDGEWDGSKVATVLASDRAWG